MKTLVAGATGLVGIDVCRRLRAAGRDVRALLRGTSDPGKRAELEAMGAELITGDLKDRGSLARACAGVQSVVSTASSTLSRQAGDSLESVDRDGQLALVAEARAAGVEHFVFVSFRDNPRIQFPLSQVKRVVEQAIISSGMAYTILQASNFMEVWLTPALGFDPAGGKVRLYGEGTGRISWVSYRDVARATAAAVLEPTARGKVVELGGPEALSQRDVARMFEEAGAGTITFESIPEAALLAQLNTSTDSMQQSFAGLMLQTATGDVIDPGPSTQLFGFELTPVRAFIAARLARS